MGELLESLASVGGTVLLVALVLWLAYRFFGAQVFGLPALLGVFVLVALASVFSTLGLATLVLMVVGLLVLFAIIGAAMTIGPERLDKARDERPEEG